MNIKCRIVFYVLLFVSNFSWAQNDENNLEALDTVTCDFLQVVRAYKGPPIIDLTLDEARQEIEGLQNAYPTRIYDVNEIREQISVNEKEEHVELIIVKPKNSQNKLLPVLMYFHGGGWVLDGYNTHKRIVHQLAYEANYAVVFVNYSLSPEAVYPKANEESYAATKWISKNGKKYNLDTSKIAVGGDSAGGNMATVIAIMAKQRKEFHIGFQLLFYPVTDTNFCTASYEEFDNGYFLNRITMQWFFDKYVEYEDQRNHITVAPLRASTKELENLPPALVITAQFDVLRDEGEAYANKLLKAGVPVTLSRYSTIHDFVALNSLAESPTSIKAIKQAVFHLRNFSMNLNLKMNNAVSDI